MDRQRPDGPREVKRLAYSHPAGQRFVRPALFHPVGSTPAHRTHLHSYRDEQQM